MSRTDHLIGPSGLPYLPVRVYSTVGGGMDPTTQTSTRTVRYWKANAEGRTRLQACLGLDRLRDVGLILDAAELIGGDVRFHVTWERVGEGWFRVVEGRNESRFCASTHVSILYEGRNVTKPLAFLMRRVAVSLRNRDLDEVIATFAPPQDETIGVPVQPTPIHTWDIPDAWYRFLCDHAVQRKFFETFSFEGPSLYLMHGDLECRFITPHAGIRLPRFFNYPWALAAEGNFGEGSEATDLDDLDVIQGGQEKLVRTLRRSIERIGDRGPILVNSTCVPIVIGDDVDGIIAAHQGECVHGIYHVGPRTTQPVDIFMQYVEDEKVRALKDRKRVPGSVALVGFRDVPARDEIVALLAVAEIPVTGCVLPGVSPERMRRALQAEVLVFNPSVVHSPLYRRVFGDVDAVRVEPAGPWGFRLSKEWFLMVAEAVGRRAEMERVLCAWDERSRERLDTWRKRAQNAALGFVIDPVSVARLYDPLSVTGLPIVPVVHEFGFEVRVALYSGEKAAFLKASDALHKALSGCERIVVTPFETPEELDAFLRDPSLRAVFTEFFYDHRLSRRGKGQFSAREFEMGLEGAVRSLERLVGIAEVPFYRDHAADLAIPSEEWWWGCET